VKVGDLVRHNGNHSVWVVTSVSSLWDRTMAILITRRNYTMWADVRAFEVISESR